ncbi:MAG: hypothetical protein ACRDHP_18600 [Ktedonobacterales bacterium]
MIQEDGGGELWSGERAECDDCDGYDSCQPLVERSTAPARFSLHARRRAARRNVIADAIAYVLAHGRVLHRTGITFHFLGTRDIPFEDRHVAWAARLAGTVVLVALDGEIITVYRNQRALPALRRKMKYRLAPRPGECAGDDPDGDTERRTA